MEREEIESLMEMLRKQQSALHRMIEETAREFALRPEELEAYSRDPKNFSQEEWQTLEEDRDQLQKIRKELWALLGLDAEQLERKICASYPSLAAQPGRSKESQPIASFSPPQVARAKMSRKEWKRSWMSI